MTTRQALSAAVVAALAFGATFAKSSESKPNATTGYTASSSGGSGSGLHFQAWGLRAGVTDGNDQVVGGAHFNLGELLDGWRFQPDVEVGTGDDVTSFVGTAPLLYQFRTSSRMTPYAGAGLTLGYFDVDEDPLFPNRDDSEFGVGARATGGLEWPRRDDQAFFVEMSVGFGDVQDLQLIAAWTF